MKSVIKKGVKQNGNKNDTLIQNQKETAKIIVALNVVEGYGEIDAHI